MTRRGKDTAIVSSSMSSLFIGWLAKAGQKASQHLRHLGPTNASVAGKCRPVLEPAGVEKRLVCSGRHLSEIAEKGALRAPVVSTALANLARYVGVSDEWH